VQAFFVDDPDFTKKRAIGNFSWRTILVVNITHVGNYFPASTRLAILMYFRPASCA
jgi:hypothetical protein